jgi:hypothetical protein
MITEVATKNSSGVGDVVLCCVLVIPDKACVPWLGRIIFGKLASCREV